MSQTTTLSCTCGKVQLAVSGEPIIVAECHCTSCRSGAQRLAQMPGAQKVTAANGGTPYTLYRKDRITFVAGAELIRSFRLTPQSSTRRAVATCCNTPLFTEFEHGHWLSLYSALWPETRRLTPDLRTQTQDAPDGTDMSGNIPAGRGPTLRFYGKLLAAWAAMGFRTPKLALGGEL